MDVSQFLDSLGPAPDIEIVIARFPERGAFGRAEFVRGILFEHLDHNREILSLRLAYEQMDVFGHDYVSGDVEVVPFAGTFEDFEEGVSRLWSSQELVAALTTKGYEVETAGFLETLETPRHVVRVLCTVNFRM